MLQNLQRLGQWMSFEELHRLQEVQLSRTLALAAKSPFYRERIKKKPDSFLIEHLFALPMTSKNDLRNSYPFGMLAVHRNRLATYHESSGTSGGSPTASYYTMEEWTDLTERFSRKSVPMSAEDTLLVRIPYAFVLAGHLAHQAGLIKGATVIGGDCRSLAAPYSRVVRALHDLNVTLTWSTASECLVWAAAARVAGYDPSTEFPALRALYVGGEPLSPARRERISKIWGAPVVEEYGCTEVGSMAGVCPAGKMHFWADRILPEVYDPTTGEFSREGYGLLVITPLYREAMPLIRYNLEDWVEIKHEKCECGWHLPTIKIFGRASQGIPVVGKDLSQYQLEQIIYQLPEDYNVMFWRAHAHADSLLVEIEVEQEYASAATTELKEAVQTQLGVPCKVESVALGTLVPHELIATTQDVMKPRKLFGPEESWDAAILRC